MTGFRHKSFRHQCDEHGCYIDSLPSWDYLDGAFPRGIVPTDVDGMVEVNGHFLFIEEKKVGATPPGGQLAALRALSRLPNVKVALTRPGQNAELQLNVLDDGAGTYFQDITRQEFWQFCQAWSEEADDSAPVADVNLVRDNNRLRRDNEMLRRQLKALIEGTAA